MDFVHFAMSVCGSVSKSRNQRHFLSIATWSNCWLFKKNNRRSCWLFCCWNLFRMRFQKLGRKKRRLCVVSTCWFQAFLDEKSSTGYSLRKGFCFSADHVLQRTNLNGNYTPVSLAMENPAFLPGKTVFCHGDLFVLLELGGGLEIMMLTFSQSGCRCK